METAHHPSAVGYAHSPPTKAAQWHGLVAADVFLNNLATGLFLVAALGDLAAPAALSAVARLAYPVALISLIADLICLVLDLGDPWRFHHMLRVVKPASPMSLGVWCLTLFSLPLTLLVMTDLMTLWLDIPPWLHVLLVLISLPPAFGSVAYKGVLFSTSAQPGWQEARWLGAYLVSSALAFGCAGLLALSLFASPAAVSILRLALGMVIALSALPLSLFLMDIWPALARVHTRRYLLVLGAIAFGGEIIVPLALLLISSAPAVLLAAVGCFLAGAAVLRYVLVMLPHGEAH